MKEAGDWAGVPADAGTVIRKPKREYRRPERPAGVRKVAEKSPVMAYLTDERKLPAEALAAYRVAEAGQVSGQEGPWIVLPFIDPAGELLGIKYLHLHRKDGKKIIRAEADCQPSLFGWPAIPPDARTVVITEGEIDAMTMWAYGFPALSVPFGGGGGNKQQWIEHEWDNLDRFDKIYLCMDSDEAGREAAREIAQRLGLHRCYNVNLPYKDANACLSVGAPVEEVKLYLESADTFDPQELRSALLYVDDVIDEFYPTGGVRPGFDLPWTRQHAPPIRLGRGELSIWTGINGHGKAVSLDTEIPTPHGWTTMGALAVGDMIFDENGRPTKVLAKSEVMTDRPCYRMTFSDGTTIVCDAGHLWLTNTILSRRSARFAAKRNRTKEREPAKRGTDQTHKRVFPSVVTTEEIANTLHGTGCASHLVNHGVNVAGVIDLPDADLPIDPYVLGVWLGDGSSNGGQITSADQEVVDALESAGYQPTKCSAKYLYGTRGLCTDLRRAGLLNNKHIPAAYLRSSVKQRLDLLSGLMDTDGHTTDYGRCEFVSMKESLAKGVYELVMSLGMQAKIIEGEAMLNGMSCGRKYRVTFTPHSLPVFRIKRKLDRLQLGNHVKQRSRLMERFIVACEQVESVPVQCVKVDSPSHLFLVTRSFVPTHNSLALGQVVLAALEQGEKACIASFEMHPRKTLKRAVSQAACMEMPRHNDIRRVHEWFDGRLWLFDLVGIAKVDRLLEVFTYGHRRYGITQFVVDSLLRCGVAEDDYTGQKALVERLCEFATMTNAHVHLVAHSRKKEDESAAARKMDVRGAGAITDLAFNVFSFWRNKEKEKFRQVLQSGATPSKGNRVLSPEEIEKMPDAVLYCDKCREEGDYEGMTTLMFDKPTMQFTNIGRSIRPYLPSRTDLPEELF
jgi:hypothetical protein